MTDGPLTEEEIERLRSVQRVYRCHEYGLIADRWLATVDKLRAEQATIRERQHKASCAAMREALLALHVTMYGGIEYVATVRIADLPDPPMPEEQ